MKFVLLISLKLLTTANSFLLSIAEHGNFSVKKYENVSYFLLAEKNSCSAELSVKKKFITSWPDIHDVSEIQKW